jgi:hypothetical protein
VSLAVFEQLRRPRSLLNVADHRGGCTWGVRPRCTPHDATAATQVLIPIALGLMRAYCAIFGWDIITRRRILRQHLYQHCRLANLWLRVEVWPVDWCDSAPSSLRLVTALRDVAHVHVHGNLPACCAPVASRCASRLSQRRRSMCHVQERFSSSIILVWVVAPLALWAVGGNACTSYTLVWLGCLPILLCFTCLTMVQLRLFQPCIPSDGASEPHAVLQQFAWTARCVPSTRARRAAVAHCPVAPAALDAPTFCFETAIKAFFWSAALYDYDAVDGHTFSARVPAGVSQLVAGTAQAMALFDLTEQQVFHDRDREIKVAVAWGGDRLVVCARGSSNAVNFLADAQVRQLTIAERQSNSIAATCILCCTHMLS